MARIPKYDQVSLASSLVGTPGVETSGAQMLGGLANDAQAVGNAEYTAQAAQYADMQAEMRQRRAEARTAAKELATMQRQAEVAGSNSEHSVMGESQADTIRKRDEWNTANSVNDLKSYLDEQTLSRLDAETDPMRKAMLQKQLNETNTSLINSMSKWVESRSAPIILSNAKSVAGNLAATLQDSNKSFDEVQRTIDRYQIDNMAMYTHAYGPEAQKAMRYDISEGIQKRLASVAMQTKNPDALEAEIRHFAPYVDSEKARPFLSDVRRLAAEERQAQALEITAQKHRDNVNAWDKAINLTTDGDLRSIPHKDFMTFRESSDFAKLTPGEQKRLIQANAERDSYLKSQELKEQRRQTALEAPLNDKILLSKFGAMVARQNELGAQLQKAYSTAISRGSGFTQKDEVHVSRLLEQYKTGMETLKGLQTSLGTTAAKDIAQTQLLNVNRLNRQIESFTGPNALKEKSNHDIVRNRVLGGLSTPKSYTTDARKTALFNYYWNNKFEDMYAEYKRRGMLAHLRDNKPVKDGAGKTHGAADLLKWQIYQYATQQVENQYGR